MALMTPGERAARECNCGFDEGHFNRHHYDCAVNAGRSLESLFAGEYAIGSAHGRARQREEDAALCERQAEDIRVKEVDHNWRDAGEITANWLAQAIRATGNTEEEDND